MMPVLPSALAAGVRACAPPVTVPCGLSRCLLMLCAVLSHSVMADSLQPHGLQPVRLLCPWGFSKQEYWSGLPCLPPVDLPNPGIKSRSPALQEDCLLSEPPGKPKNTGVGSLSLIASLIINITQQSGTFVTIDVPRQTCHYQSKSIIYIRVLGFVYSWVWTKYMDTYRPLQYLAEEFHCLKNPLCLLINPSLPSTPSNHYFF